MKLSSALGHRLYRRDRDWYVANVQLPRPAAHAAFDWNKRDEILGARVLMAAAKIKTESGKPHRVTIVAIGRELREKKNLRVNLAKLPLTRLAIQGVIENNEQFALRRTVTAFNNCSRAAGK